MWRTIPEKEPMAVHGTDEKRPKEASGKEAAMSKKLGELVKKARTEKGLTQAALAKKVKGLTASDISKIERGEKEPDKEALKSLAKALDVTQSSLVSAASGKTAAKKTAKTGSTAAKKTAKNAKASSKDLKLTAAVTKLIQLYRKADAETKKTAVSLLDGTVSVKDLLASFLHAKTGSAAKPSSGMQDLLGSLLGGNTSQSSGKEESLLGTLLGDLLDKQ